MNSTSLAAIPQGEVGFTPERRELPLILWKPRADRPIARLSWKNLKEYGDDSGGPRWHLEGSPAAVLLAKRLMPGAICRRNDFVSWPAVRALFEDLLMIQHRYQIEVAPNATAAWNEQWADLTRSHEARLGISGEAAVGGGNFTGTLMAFQEEGVAFAVASRRSLNADEMGLGKEQPVDALVMTPSGWRAIGDIRVGDRVTGSHGQPVNVIGVFPQGVKASYRVTFSDGSSVEAGAEHLWTMRYWRGGKQLTDLTLTTEQLRLRPVIGRLDLAKTTLYLPMLSAPARFDPVGQLPIPSYAMGQLIAHGCLGHGTPKLTMAAVDWPETQAHVMAEGVDIGGGAQYGNIIHASVRAICRPIAGLALDVGSRDLTIPPIYLRAAPDDRLALLQGLMDGNGGASKTKNKVTYHTTSRRLAAAVQELVECLGGIASVRSYDRSAEGKPTDYQVRLRLPLAMAPFRLERKASRRRPGKNAAPTRSVRSVAFVRDVESVCIAVDAPDRLYVTEHAILTHNTVTALSWLDRIDEWPAVVVCQPHLMRHWAGKIPEFLNARAAKELPGLDLGGLTWSALKGMTPGKPGSGAARAHIYLVHYLVLQGWSRWLVERGVRSVVFDEVQETRHSGTSKYAACQAVARSARNVLGLSGTPIYGKGVEIHSVMNTIDRGSLGTKTEFQDHWCRKEDPSVVEEPALLGQYLRDRGLMIRRRKEEVLTELPERRRVVEMIDADNERFATLVLEAQKLAREAARQVDPFDRGRMEAEAINLTRKATGIAKAPAVVLFLLGLLEAEEPTLVFAHHHGVVDAIMEGLRKFKPTCITGRETLAEKGRAQDAFMAGETNLCLISLRSATGLDGFQHRARVVVFAELDWSPAVHSQAEGRAHRFGQRDSVLAYYLTADIGTDPIIMDLLAIKEQQALGLLGDRVESDEDRGRAQDAAKEHMAAVLRMLRGGA